MTITEKTLNGLGSSIIKDIYLAAGHIPEEKSLIPEEDCTPFLTPEEFDRLVFQSKENKTV